MAYRVLHCGTAKFLAAFSAMQVQGAIDFAALRCGVGGDSEAIRREGFKCQPRFSPRNTPRNFFCKCILQAAIDFAEAADAERSWSSGANGGAECRTFFGVAGFAPKPNF